MGGTCAYNCLVLLCSQCLIWVWHCNNYGHPTALALMQHATCRHQLQWRRINASSPIATLYARNFCIYQGMSIWFVLVYMRHMSLLGSRIFCRVVRQSVPFNVPSRRGCSSRCKDGFLWWTNRYIFVSDISLDHAASCNVSPPRTWQRERFVHSESSFVTHSSYSISQPDVECHVAATCAFRLAKVLWVQSKLDEGSLIGLCSTVELNYVLTFGLHTNQYEIVCETKPVW